MSRTHTLVPFVAAALASFSSALIPAVAGARATDDGPTGTSRQSIVAGDDVSVAQQEELGLISVGDDCSGTLLNTYWVLTADHCITGGAIGGPPLAPSSIKLRAKWRTGSVRPTRIVRFWTTNALDVALLFMGDTNFGSRARKVRPIYHDAVDPSMTLAKFGRGICAYAFVDANDIARPAQRNCGYKRMIFQPTAANSKSIELVPNEAGQMYAGGDSGGPDFVTDGRGNLLAIAGVSSTCRWTVIDGKEFGWDWVNGVTDCSSAALADVRDNIIHHMKEEPGIAVTLTRDDDKIYESRDKPAATRSKSPYIGGN